MPGLFGGGLAGLVRFISASLQQVGLVYTTAGKVGFAALGGWIVLGETLILRVMTGCALMLAGMLSSQLRTYLFNR